MAALDSALVALIPELEAADLPEVQAILAENYRLLAEFSGTNKFPDSAADTIPLPGAPAIAPGLWLDR